jgi:hypothetical protein
VFTSATPEQFNVQCSGFKVSPHLEPFDKLRAGLELWNLEPDRR